MKSLSGKTSNIMILLVIIIFSLFVLISIARAQNEINTLIYLELEEYLVRATLTSDSGDLLENQQIDFYLNDTLLGSGLTNAEGFVDFPVSDKGILKAVFNGNPSLFYNPSETEIDILFKQPENVTEYEINITRKTVSPLKTQHGSVIGEFYPSNEIEIVKQDYISKYIQWEFTEINSTHWLVNFTVDPGFINEIKLVKEKGLNDFCKNRFSEKLDCSERVTVDIEKLDRYPLESLTKNIVINKEGINVLNGFGSFYLIFPSGFKANEKAKFGFDSTVIGTTTSTIPFYPDERSICRDGQGYLHVAWLFKTNEAITYANSTDDGETWNLYNISTKTYSRGQPFISCHGDNITIAYVNNAADDVLVNISTDNGGTWSGETAVTNGADIDVSMERRGEKIYIVYKNFLNSDIEFVNSSDGGSTWGAAVTVQENFPQTFPLCQSRDYYQFSMAVDGTGGSLDHIMLVYQEVWRQWEVGAGMCELIVEEEEWGIMFIRSTTSGAAWGAQKTVKSRDTPELEYPSITFNQSDSADIFVSYWDSTNNNINFSNSTGGGSSWTTPYQIDTASGGKNARYASVTIDSQNNPWVFWEQNEYNNNYDIVYRKFNGTDWETVQNVTDNNHGNTYANTKYNYSDKIEYVWRNGTSAPYQIMYGYSYDYEDPPTYSKNSTNTTYSGQSCKFSLEWNDDNQLQGGGGYIFSTNNTGTWKNASWYAFSSTPENATNVTVLNSTPNTVVAWCFYANDSNGNWNNTNCQAGNEFWLNTTIASFAVTIPNNSVIFSSTAGNATPDEEFNSSTGDEKNVTVWVKGTAYKQNSTYIGDVNNIANFKVNNTGNVNENITMCINESLPSSIVLFGTKSENPYDTQYIIPVCSSGAWVANSSLPVNAMDEFWIWANFTYANVNDATVIKLYINSTEST